MVAAVTFELIHVHVHEFWRHAYAQAVPEGDYQMEDIHKLCGTPSDAARTWPGVKCSCVGALTRAPQRWCSGPGGRGVWCNGLGIPLYDARLGRGLLRATPSRAGWPRAADRVRSLMACSSAKSVWRSSANARKHSGPLPSIRRSLLLPPGALQRQRQALCALSRRRLIGTGERYQPGLRMLHGRCQGTCIV